jgi:hypothetical protein
MLPFDGAVTVSEPEAAVNDIPTKRWSIPKAWVTAPFRTRTTEEMFAASGVDIVNAFPYEMELGAVLIVGRVAAPPLELNRYGG